ncbi:MAG: T9SS type A sorting domain-containing protein [Bacteroidales bacterium]|nr:T9SS type A sorting domain-containing protein [Bacteroidales bacterium]
MKQILILLLLAVIITSSYSQTKQQFDQKVDSILAINLQNHVRQDTLWVLDKSMTYQGLITKLERTYEVLSRNEQGNALIAIDLVDEGYAAYSGNNTFDSIVYFDGEQVEKKFSKVWNSYTQKWVENDYKEYEATGLVKERLSKGYIDYLSEYRYGYRDYYYNNSDRPDSSFTYSYLSVNDSWLPKAKTVYFYDDHGNDTLIWFYKWNESQWQDSARLHQHFQNNMMVLALGYVFREYSHSWGKYFQQSKSYNAAGLLDTLSMRFWDNNDNNWYDYSKKTYTYDNQNRIVHRLELLKKYSPQMENDKNYFFEYNVDSEIIIYQRWSAQSDMWVNATLQITSLIADNIIDTVQLQAWDDYYEKWAPQELNLNKYDSHFNLVESSEFFYYSNDWVFKNKTDYYWSPFIPNAIPEIIANAVDVFPNPALTQVSFVLPEDFVLQNEETFLQVFNLSGQKIAEIPIKEGKAIWNCSSVKPGLYVYSTVLNRRKITGKIVVTN